MSTEDPLAGSNVSIRDPQPVPSAATTASSEPAPSTAPPQSERAPAQQNGTSAPVVNGNGHHRPAPHPVGSNGNGVAAAAVLRACTVATRADLPAVRVLSSSFLGKHSTGRFVALIVDAEPGEAGPGAMAPADIGFDPAELAWLATACTPRELCAVLRPWLLSRLLLEGGPVLYLDPSIVVLDSVADQVLTAAARWPVVLAPRVLQPLPRDGLRPGPDELLSAGRFDPGFLTVAPGAEEFLRIWADQVRQAPDAADSFLDGAPALVEHHVLRDPGIGVSVWNATQRPVERDEHGQLTVQGQPLRTAHFAGFDPARPWLLSAELADRPRVLLSEHPQLAELCATYRNELVRAGAGQESTPYRFAGLADGIPLPVELRRDFRTAWLSAENSGEPTPPPAFDDQDSPAFLRWACAPGDEHQAAVGASRWAAALWREDSALRERFPEPFGADAPAFRGWCASTGVSSGRLHPDAVPQVDPGRALTMVDQLGVSVLGSGPDAELLRAAVRASGLPSADEPMYPVVLRCTGAGPVPADRYVISVLPKGTSAGDLDGASELWVASDSTKDLLSRTGLPLVRAVALPVLDTGVVDLPARKAARARLDLPEGLVFASTVDHAAERQSNALGLVSAFLAAFPDRHDVHLLLGVAGAGGNPEAAERLRLATAADPRVRLVEQDGIAGHGELLDVADCVVSLHRVEGIAGDRVALLLVAAAARGLPVLASEHGAVAELLATDAAMLVPCHPGGREPDADGAVRLMRAIADNPDTAANLGAAARTKLLETRGVKAAGEQVREQIEHAYRSWRTKRAAARHSPQQDPLQPLQTAKHALLRRANPDAESRMPMAPALRKGVLRVLSHYDNHLREVLTAVVQGVERTATELARRQNEIEAGPVGSSDLGAEVADLTDRQSKLDDQLVGVDDGVLRARADIANQGRRLRALEEAVAAQASTSATQIDSLAERLDRLTGALDRTLDRIDDLESRVAGTLRERDSRLESGLRAATEALRTTDALRRVVVREHERHVVPDEEAPPSSLVLTEAGLLRLPAEDSMMLPLLSTNGVWQPELCALIDSLLEPDGVFVDVGAHIGYHTIRVLSRLGTSGAVVAVEPCAATRDLLKRNVEVNLKPAVAARLAVLGVAAWDANAELEVGPALTGGISLSLPTPQPTPEVVPDEGTADPVEVETMQAVRLDKALDELPALAQMRLSVVKVDVPGRSHRALGGLVRLLRRDRPHVVCSFAPAATTALGDDPAAALHEFRTWGYELVPLGASEAMEPAALLELAHARAGGSSTMTLWLRPRGWAG